MKSDWLQAGYNMCQDLEQKHSWISCRDWYSCVVEMCENYQVTSSQYTINKYLLFLFFSRFSSR